MDYKKVWDEYLQQACDQRIKARVFAAFNTNVDAIVHVHGELVRKLIESDESIDWGRVNNLSIGDISSIKSKEEFMAVLKDRLFKGKSFHIVLENTDLLAWLDEHFTGVEESMGGQAGIIANQMAALGADSMVYTPLLSEKQANLFHKTVTTPVITEDGLSIKTARVAARPNDETKINWIFEYAANETFTFLGEVITTPRANRIILATRPRGSVMSFSREMARYLPQLGKRIDVAFLAGYHYAEPINVDGRTFGEFMSDTVEHLRSLKQGNPAIKLHYEYVPMKRPELESQMLKTISQEIKSFGINENEIKRVLKEYGFEEELAEIEREERAYSLYKGALKLWETMRLDRIQVHNLGYYVLVLRKPYPVPPEQVRQACLFASSVNAMKAKYGGYVMPEQLAEAAGTPLSDVGLEQLARLVEELKEERQDADKLLQEGYLEFADHYLLVTPAHIIPDPVSTVGMGDTISSSSYAMEWRD